VPRLDGQDHPEIVVEGRREPGDVEGAGPAARRDAALDRAEVVDRVERLDEGARPPVSAAAAPASLPLLFTSARVK
jgi:hypothetical protein